jgi:hypothetical protein
MRRLARLSKSFPVGEPQWNGIEGTFHMGRVQRIASDCRMYPGRAVSRYQATMLCRRGSVTALQPPGGNYPDPKRLNGEVKLEGALGRATGGLIKSPEDGEVAIFGQYGFRCAVLAAPKPRTRWQHLALGQRSELQASNVQPRVQKRFEKWARAYAART